MALASGTRLGPYEISGALGAGGMGEVYKARDTRLDRTVAIKILPASLASDLEFRGRFDREARTISQLDHPHICALYDVGTHDGTAYLVMQYLEGRRWRSGSNGARCHSIRPSGTRLKSPTRSREPIVQGSSTAI
jgi:serine/threonine protein kinase